MNRKKPYRHFKVSIIIPAFNSAKTIRRCLRSVFSQTFRSFEVLLINDGSTDQTVDIAVEFDFHDNLRIISQPHVGVSQARWKGIRESRGDYIAFVDADDEVDPEMLSTVFENVSRTGALIGVFNFYLIEKDIKKILFNYKDCILSPEEAIELTIIKNNNGHLWNKIFHRSLFCYEIIKPTLKIQYTEDLLLVSCIFLKNTKPVTFIAAPLYLYYVNNASLSHAPRLKDIADYFLVHKKVRNMFLKMGSSVINKELPFFYFYHATLAGWIQLELGSLKNSPKTFKMKKAALNRCKNIPFHLLLKSGAGIKILLKYWLIRMNLFAFLFKLKNMFLK